MRRTVRMRTGDLVNFAVLNCSPQRALRKRMRALNFLARMTRMRMRVFHFNGRIARGTTDCGRSSSTALQTRRSGATPSLRTTRFNLQGKHIYKSRLTTLLKKGAFGM
ncbi:hypothetical protein NDU88_001654 [Pleurodeles waltl]|uniref:Uncharacterized protein n=1 Tax=Pleurodeles waltl TaxID=8319 RepID=A0AAV7RD84_PLEWA|nr:hypothetical protein NDU88_001654 [Pleurodeles waltl]